MTNKLVVIINSLKIPKIKQLLLYDTQFLVPNYSCLQNPWIGVRGYRPRIPVLCPQLNLLNPPPARTKFLGTPLVCVRACVRVRVCCVRGIYEAYCTASLIAESLTNCRNKRETQSSQYWQAGKISFFFSFLVTLQNREDRLSASSGLSVCPSERKNSASIRLIFMKFHNWERFSNICRGSTGHIKI